MTKFAYIADPLDYQTAGIYRYVRGWTDHWPQVFSEDENHLIRAKEVEEKGWIVHPVKNKFPGKYGRYLRKITTIPNCVNKIKPDVVIESAHFGPYNLHRKIRRFVTIHDLSPITRPSNHTFLSEYGHRLLIGPTVRRADGIIVNSEKTKHEVSEVMNFPLERIQVVYPGIAPHFKKIESKERLIEMGINKPYFLHVGTIEPRKQVHKVVRAFEWWCRENPRSEELLVLAGRMGWKMHAFHRFVQQSPAYSRILYLDFVPDEDLPVLYSHASALLMLSVDEGFGFPVTEALFCGCPVVAAKVKSFQESGGKHPIIVSEIKEENIVAAMQKAINLDPDPEEIRKQLSHLEWRKSFLKLKKFIEQF